LVESPFSYYDRQARPSIAPDRRAEIQIRTLPDLASGGCRVEADCKVNEVRLKVKACESGILDCAAGRTERVIDVWDLDECGPEMLQQNPSSEDREMYSALRSSRIAKPCRATALFGLALLVAPAADRSAAGDQATSVVKRESFDKDPNWEGHNNRLRPLVIPTITQDFGYSPTRLATEAKGEAGGKVVRCATPTYYAAPLTGKTLDDKLTASGTFALTGAAGSSGVFFGWFNSRQQDGGGRPVQSLGLDIDGEPSGARLAVRMINGSNKSCGTFITPFLPGKFRPTPIRLDGTRYSWTLNYDPEANGGRGQFRFTIQSHSTRPEPLAAQRLPADLPAAHKTEALNHFPNTTVFTVDLPAGFKDEGASFDRFGLLNLMKPGNPMTIYFGDLKHDGMTEDFTKDPGWVGFKNRATIEAAPVGAHDFGFSAKTSYAGGKPGEVGGDLWRSGKYGYYADRVGPLTLDDRLEARGKVVLKVGAPDSDIYIGWFSGAGKEESPAHSGSFVGVHVGGPTRVGHYFLPEFTTAKGTKGKVDRGPILTPGKVFDWSLTYDPAASGGQGELRVTLGQETVTLRLKPGQKAEGARLDRFGLFNSTVGGQLVRIFLDDLQYTAQD
jgi:hypothetical protein